MGLRHDNPNSLEPDPLRTQRMTADEAKSVTALWQQERVVQTGLTDQPAVPDVAEGLDVPVEEVQRLLAEVRARRVEEELRLAREQKLAQAEARLAEEEARLADVQQQRAEVRRAKAGRRGGAASRRQAADIEPVPWEVWKATHSPVRWAETEPGVWEDVNQQEPTPLLSSGVKAGAVVVCLMLSAAVSVLACLVWILSSVGRN